MSFNERQKEIINHVNGPMLCIAGPGSGKTTSIIQRVAHLIDSGIDPMKILVITFTKAAALEMKGRYNSRPDSVAGPVFSTIHSLCFKVLNKYNPRVFNKTNILTGTEQAKILSPIIKQLRLEAIDYYSTINAACSAISFKKNTGKSFGDNGIEYFTKEQLNTVYSEYEKEKKRLRKIDLDDLLLYTYKLLKSNNAFLNYLRNKFSHIMIDEFQDTNKVQAHIFYLLAAPKNNICVVGDDDQSIYGFRGAEPGVMFDFEKKFPGCKRVVLNANYRSTHNIVEVSKQLISCNKTRYDKDLVADNDKDGFIGFSKQQNMKSEVETIIQKITKFQAWGVPLSQIAILYRTAVEAQPLLSALIEWNIPFYTKDPVVCAFEHWIFQDILLFKKASDGNISMREFLRIVNRPNKYVPAKVLPNKYDPTLIIQSCNYISNERSRAQCRGQMIRFFYFLEEMKKDDPKTFIFKLCHDLDYLDYLDQYVVDNNVDKSQLLDILNLLISTASKFKTFDEWTLYAATATRKFKDKIKRMTRENSVFVSTMHKAKGLEWQHVIIMDANEEINPYYRAEFPADIEEERRLFYVAVTRAKKSLMIYYLEKRGENNLSPSRFLFEMGLMKSLGGNQKRRSNSNRSRSGKASGFCKIK